MGGFVVEKKGGMVQNQHTERLSRLHVLVLLEPSRPFELCIPESLIFPVRVYCAYKTKGAAPGGAAPFPKG
jgi:hypothetical protein